MLLHRWVIDWIFVATTLGSSEAAFPVGAWERVQPGAKNGRGWGEMAGKFGSPSIGFGYQVANDVETVDASQRVSALIRAHGIRLWLRGLPIATRPRHVNQEGV